MLFEGKEACFFLSMVSVKNDSATAKSWFCFRMDDDLLDLILAGAGMKGEGKRGSISSYLL